MTDSPDSAAEAHDPEIEALLDFEPVPRKYKRADSWTPALQRRFIRWLAKTGSPARAAEALRKDRFGIEKLYKANGAESFREAWDKAIALFEERDAARQAAQSEQWVGVRPPGGVDRRLGGGQGRGTQPGPTSCGECGQLIEDADVDREQYLDTMRSIRSRLLRARRALLLLLSTDRQKRQAWEVLVGPVDWERARRLEPQDDEPCPDPARNRQGLPSMRKADMVLTIEAGLLPELTGGYDAMAEIRRRLQPPSPPSGGEGRGEGALRPAPSRYGIDDETDAMLNAIAAAKTAHPEDFD